ncbi:MAG: AAA family ATPase [Thermoguttaceae bacterium]|nr:AAA family ATPase [Thermoguttaceae bacterium]
MIKKLSVKNFGPIESGEIEFGDLTIFVGPQASGKSLLLQLYRLLEDSEAIYTFCKNNNRDWRIVSLEDNPRIMLRLFSELYFGGGMQLLWAKDPEIKIDETDINFYKLVSQPSQKTKHSVFYIPAQRTLAFDRGWPRQFSAYSFGTPFSLSFFSDSLWNLLDRGFVGTSSFLFPAENRLKKQFRENIDNSIYWGDKIKIRTDYQKGSKSLELIRNNGPKDLGLSYTAWSSGQREFTPLLLGCYHLLPAQATTKKEDIDTIIIEEPEMGLHPQAIISFFQLVIELMWRGYRVIISTHSNVVLDLVWAIVEYQELYAKRPENVDKIYTAFVKMLNLKKSIPIKEIFNSVIQKRCKTYSFNHSAEGVQIQDISSLDPVSEDYNISGWGGITGCSSSITDSVGNLYDQLENR